MKKTICLLLATLVLGMCLGAAKAQEETGVITEDTAAEIEAMI